MFEKVTIKHGGNYHEWGNEEHPLSELDLPLAEDGQTLLPEVTDEQLKSALMAALDAEQLDGFVVDPPEAERLAGQHGEKSVLNVRPTATYG